MHFHSFPAPSGHHWLHFFFLIEKEVGKQSLFVASTMRGRGCYEGDIYMLDRLSCCKHFLFFVILNSSNHKITVSCLITVHPMLSFSRSAVSNSLWPHGLQHTRLPCPSPSSGACSNSCPLSWRCHPTISSLQCDLRQLPHLVESHFSQMKYGN